MTQRVSLIGGSISFAMLIFLNGLGACPAQGAPGAPAFEEVGRYEEEVGRYEEEVGRYEEDVTADVTKREQAPLATLPPATTINDSTTRPPSSQGGPRRGL